MSCLQRVKLCVCERERENKTMGSVFMLPVSFPVRTFNAVILSFFTFDDSDNEDELLGAH